MIKYYGSYLHDPQEKHNNSISQDKLLGQTTMLQVRTGLGLEYRVENYQSRFIHLFAEGGIGSGLIHSASRQAFSNTRSTNNTWINIGINVGIVKSSNE